MAINIQSLFSDIIETPAQRQERMLTEGILRGRELTGGLTGLASTQAPLISALSMQMPQRQEALRRGVGGMLGLDVRTESEKLQDVLKGVDPSKPESIIAAAQRVGELGMGAQAAQMRAMAAEQKRQQQAQDLESLKTAQEIRALQAKNNQLSNNREAAISFIQNSSLPNGEKNAYLSAARLGTFDESDAFENLLNRIDPKASERYIKDEEGIYDSVANTWLRREVIEDVAELEISPTDPDEYEPWSFARYEKAFTEASSDEERIKARELLVRKHPDGWQYEMMVDTEGNTILDQNGNEKMVAMPLGVDRARFVAEFRAANNAGEVIRNRSDNLIDLTDELINQISETDENGQYTNEVKTGFTGIVFNLIPGTNNYEFTGDVETLLANMGFNALNEARTNSQNGSSGFGQLTEKEMDLLQSLVTNLRQGGLSREEFISRLREVKQEFTRIRDVTKSTRNSPWTLRQWVGIEQPTEPERISSGGVIPGGGSTTSFTQQIGGQTITVKVGEPNG